MHHSNVGVPCAQLDMTLTNPGKSIPFLVNPLRTSPVYTRAGVYGNCML